MPVGVRPLRQGSKIHTLHSAACLNIASYADHGTGYVGLVTGACLSFVGHRVTCVDSDAGKIATLRAGQVPFYEPHLADLIALARKRGGIDFGTDLRSPVAASEVIFIAVGTPALPKGASD